MQKRTYNKCLKVIATLTVCIFTWTTVVLADPGRVYRVKVPESYGKVKQRYKGTSDKTIIHIQDAHTSSEAQENIARLINHLVAKEGVKTVAVEGAVGPLDLTAYREFPIQEARDTVAHDYMKQGIFSASEYSAITSENVFKLIGAEEKELFHDNFYTFYRTMQQREEILTQVGQLEEVINSLKTPVYSPELKEFDELLDTFDRGELDIIQFIAKIFEHSHKALYDDVLLYPYTVQLREVILLEQKVDFDASRAERETVKSELILRLSDRPEEKTKLLSYDEQFEKQAITEKEYTQAIRGYAQRAEIDLAQYKHFKEFLSYLEAYSRLDFSQLLVEVWKLSQDVQARLAESTDARELAQCASLVRLLKKLAELRALNEEVAYFYEHRHEFDIASIRSRLRYLAQKYAVPFTIADELIQIADIVRHVEEFYTVAEARNAALIKNTLAEMEAAGEDISILIGGGFHTEGITKELRKKDINYLVVTPQISSLTEDIPYVEKMTGKLFPLAPELMSNINAMTTYIAANQKMLIEEFSEEGAAEAIKQAVQDILDEFGEEIKKLDLSNEQELLAKLERLREREDLVAWEVVVRTARELLKEEKEEFEIQKRHLTRYEIKRLLSSKKFQVALQSALEEFFKQEVTSDETQLLPDNFYRALEQYNIELESVDSVEPLISSRMGTYWITTQGEGFVLKREPQRESAVRYAIGISDFYRDVGIPSPQYVPNNDGEYVTRVNGEIFTLQHFLSGQICQWDMITDELLVAFAHLLAHIHIEGRKYEKKTGEEDFQSGSDPDFLTINNYYRMKEEILKLYKALENETNDINAQLTRITDSAKKERFQEILLIDELALKNRGISDEAFKYIESQLPRNVFENLPRTFSTHGDFVNANLLADGNHPTGVIDFERSSQHGLRWDDLLGPIYGHEYVPRHEFPFQRFALWLTAYNQSLRAEDRFTNIERQPQVLRALLLMVHIKGIHMVLQNRHKGAFARNLKTEYDNIRLIQKISEENFKRLSLYLKEGKLWDIKTESDVVSWRQNAADFIEYNGGDAWVCDIDVAQLGDWNNYYTREVVDMIGMEPVVTAIQEVSAKREGHGFRTGGDEITVVLPDLDETAVAALYQEIQDRIDDNVKDKYGFAVLSTVDAANQEIVQDILDRDTQFTQHGVKPIRVGERIEKGTFILFKKETTESVKDRLNEILSASGLVNYVTVVDEFEVLAPAVRMGAVRIQDVIEKRNLDASIRQNWPELLRVAQAEAALTQRIAKEKDQVMRIGVEREEMRVTEVEDELNEERIFMRTKLIDDDKALARYVEDYYPSINIDYLEDAIEHSVKDPRAYRINIIRGPPDTFYVILKLSDNDVRLLKIPAFYEALPENLEAFKAAAAGREYHRVFDVEGDTFHFGFKVINDAISRSVGNQVILANNMALYQTFQDVINDIQANPNLIDEALQQAEQKVNNRFEHMGFRVRFSAAHVRSDEVDNDVKKLTRTVDMLANIRKTMTARVKSYSDVMADNLHAAIEEEVLEDEWYKSERSKVILKDGYHRVIASKIRNEAEIDAFASVSDFKATRETALERLETVFGTSILNLADAFGREFIERYGEHLMRIGLAASISRTTGQYAHEVFTEGLMQFKNELLQHEPEVVRAALQRIAVALEQRMVDPHFNRQAHRDFILAGIIQKAVPGDEGKLRPPPEESTTIDAEEKKKEEGTPSSTATLPETYRLAEKAGLTPEVAERELAPVVEELGVFAKILYRQRLSKIAWKDWLTSKDVWTLTLKSRLLLALTSPFLASSPYLLAGITIAAVIQSFYFGFTHEKGRLRNTIAGLLFSAPFFFVHHPAMILASIALHYIVNNFDTVITPPYTWRRLTAIGVIGIFALFLLLPLKGRTLQAQPPTPEQLIRMLPPQVSIESQPPRPGRVVPGAEEVPVPEGILQPNIIEEPRDLILSFGESMDAATLEKYINSIREQELLEFTVVMQQVYGTTIFIKIGEYEHDAFKVAKKLNDALKAQQLKPFTFSESEISWQETKTYTIMRDFAETVADIAERSALGEIDVAKLIALLEGVTYVESKFIHWERDALGRLRPRESYTKAIGALQLILSQSVEQMVQWILTHKGGLGRYVDALGELDSMREEYVPKYLLSQTEADKDALVQKMMRDMFQNDKLIGVNLYYALAAWQFRGLDSAIVNDIAQRAAAIGVESGPGAWKPLDIEHAHLQLKRELLRAEIVFYMVGKDIVSEVFLIEDAEERYKTLKSYLRRKVREEKTYNQLIGYTYLFNMWDRARRLDIEREDGAHVFKEEAPAYFNVHERNFDEELAAAAAYNAGWGTVDKALKAFGATVDPESKTPLWIQHMFGANENNPREPINYLRMYLEYKLQYKGFLDQDQYTIMRDLIQERYQRLRPKPTKEGIILLEHYKIVEGEDGIERYSEFTRNAQDPFNYELAALLASILGSDYVDSFIISYGLEPSGWENNILSSRTPTFSSLARRIIKPESRHYKAGQELLQYLNEHNYANSYKALTKHMEIEQAQQMADIERLKQLRQDTLRLQQEARRQKIWGAVKTAATYVGIAVVLGIAAALIVFSIRVLWRRGTITRFVKAVKAMMWHRRVKKIESKIFEPQQRYQRFRWLRQLANIIRGRFFLSLLLTLAAAHVMLPSVALAGGFGEIAGMGALAIGVFVALAAFIFRRQILGVLMRFIEKLQKWVDASWRERRPIDGEDIDTLMREFGVDQADKSEANMQRLTQLLIHVLALEQGTEDVEQIYINDETFHTYEQAWAREDVDGREVRPVKLFRVGTLLFVDADVKALIPAHLLSMYADSILFINELSTTIAQEGVREFTSLAITGLLYLRDEIKNDTVLDLGTGVGVLGMVGLKSKAEEAIGIDYENYLPQIADNLFINEVAESIFHWLQEDLANTAAIVEKLGDRKEKVGVAVANIGPHYKDADIFAAKLMAHLPNVRYFIASGYKGMKDRTLEAATPLTSHHMETELGAMQFESIAEIRFGDALWFNKAFIARKELVDTTPVPQPPEESLEKEGVMFDDQEIDALLIDLMGDLNRDDSILSWELANELLKHPVEDIMVVGAGLQTLPFILALKGKRVTYVDIYEPLYVMTEARYDAIADQVKAQGGSMQFIMSEIGALDLKEHGILPHSYDCITMIDLAYAVPRGDAEQWILKAAELTKEDAYLVIDESEVMFREDTLKDYIYKHFTAPKLLGDDMVFQGSYNAQPTNRLYQVINIERVAYNRAHETLRVNEQLIDEQTFADVAKDKKLILVAKQSDYATFYKAIAGILQGFERYIDFKFVADEQYMSVLTDLLPQQQNTVLLIPTAESLGKLTSLERSFHHILIEPTSAKHYIVFISILKALIAWANTEDKAIALQIMGDFIKPKNKMLQISNDVISQHISSELERSVKQRFIAMAA